MIAKRDSCLSEKSVDVSFSLQMKCALLNTCFPAIDRCLSRFSVPCSRNAECLESEGVDPKCVCRKGYHGDGFRCTNRENVKAAAGNRLVTDLTHHLMEAAGGGSFWDYCRQSDDRFSGFNATAVSENPFVMKTWVPDRTTPPTVQRPKFATVQTPPLLYTGMSHCFNEFGGITRNTYYSAENRRKERVFLSFRVVFTEPKRKRFE